MCLGLTEFYWSTVSGWNMPINTINKKTADPVGGRKKSTGWQMYTIQDPKCSKFYHCKYFLRKETHSAPLLSFKNTHKAGYTGGSITRLLWKSATMLCPTVFLDSQGVDFQPEKEWVMLIFCISSKSSKSYWTPHFSWPGTLIKKSKHGRTYQRR